MADKYLPNVGDKCYLRQFTGDYYADKVKIPYTVIEVSPKAIKVQECKMTPPVYHCCGNPNLDRPDLEGQRVWFYDTVAESIEPDITGEVKELVWHGRKGLWGTKGKASDYPEYAIIGEYKHFPYLN